MTYISNYNIPNYSSYFNQNWGVKSLINSISDMIDEKRALNRQSSAGINMAIKESKYSSLVYDRNRKQATDMIQGLQDLNTNAMMYKMDEDGSFTEKRRSLFEGVSDRENVFIQSQTRDSVAEIDKLYREEQLIAQAEQEHRNNPGLYDSVLFDEAFERYVGKGEDFDTIKSLLLVRRGIEPSLWSNDKKLSSNLDYDRNAIEIVDPNNPNQLIKVTPSAPEDMQRAVFNNEIMTDDGKAIGMIDEMIKNEDPDDVIALIAGSMDYYNPEDHKTVAQAEKDAKNIYTNYRAYKTLTPDLKEASITYGEHKGYHRNIGKGYQSGPYVNKTAYNDSLKRGRDKSEETTDYTPTETRPFNIKGIEIQGVDLSQSNKIMLQNYQLPKGSFKITSEVGNRNQSKIDSLMSKLDKAGKKESRKIQKEIDSLKGEDRPYTKKQFITDVVTKDYEVVTYGGDKYGGDEEYIVIKEPDNNDKKGDYIFVPMKGNDGLLQYINKNYKKDEEFKASQGKKTINWE